MQSAGYRPFEVQPGDERLTWPELEGTLIGIQIKDLVMDCVMPETVAWLGRDKCLHSLPPKKCPPPAEKDPFCSA